MSFFLLIVIILIGTCIGWLVKPYWYKNIHQSDFEGLVRKLVRLLDNGGVLVIRHRKTKKFVQFARYTEKKGVRLHFGFPRAPWSNSVFDEFRIRLEMIGMSPVVAKTDNNNVPEFLELNWFQPNEMSYKQAKDVAILAFNVMGILTDGAFEANFSGPHNKDADQQLFQDVRDDAGSARWAKRLAKYALSKRKQ